MRLAFYWLWQLDGDVRPIGYRVCLRVDRPKPHLGPGTAAAALAQVGPITNVHVHAWTETNERSIYRAAMLGDAYMVRMLAVKTDHYWILR